MDIRNLNKKINENVQTIILAVLSILYGFSYIYGLDNAYDFIVNTITILLVLAAVWTLFINPNHSNFASYFVLLFLGFISDVTIFFRWLFSLNLKTGFIGDFPWLSFILLPCAVYLAIMAVSVFLDEGFKFNRECFNLDQSLILFPILIFLESGINVLLAVLVVEFVACNYRPLASHFLMLSKTIVIPFMFFRILFKFGFSFLTMGHWLLTILAFYVMFLLFKDFYKAYIDYKNPKDEGCCVEEEITKVEE